MAIPYFYNTVFEPTRMNSAISTYSTDVFNDQPVSLTFSKPALYKKTGITQLFEEPSDLVREGFLSYIELLGLSSETKMLVIPSIRHYFYEPEDLKGVSTVINLKHLNHVREMRDFLRAISEILPVSCNFIGCFIDNKSQNGFSDKYSNLPGNLSERAEAYETGIESKIPFINRMYSFIDFRTNRYLTRRSVSNMLEESGLQTISMTEINGLTYFYSKKINTAA